MDTEKEMDKVKNATDAFCRSLGQRTSCKATLSYVLGFGAVLLFFGAVLFLSACVTAPYLWKLRDKNVYNVRYSLNINGEVREGSMEIDSDNNLERFKTGSGAEEAVEIHDFQIGITGIRFFGGDKCYIKSQIKANLPLLGAHNKDTLMFDLTDELLPVTFGEESLVWVAAEQPLKDTTFLSNKILDLCGELPIYWLQSVFFKDGERKKRGVRRAKRQLNMEEMEAAAEERDPVSLAEHDATETADRGESAAGSAYNPENPYHRSGGVTDESAVTFDTMLEHRGICCSECHRSLTHCQRVCDPLGGYWPWPYHHRGCQLENMVAFRGGTVDSITPETRMCAACLKCSQSQRQGAWRNSNRNHSGFHRYNLLGPSRNGTRCQTLKDKEKEKHGRQQPDFAKRSRQTDFSKGFTDRCNESDSTEQMDRPVLNH